MRLRSASLLGKLVGYAIYGIYLGGKSLVNAIRNRYGKKDDAQNIQDGQTAEQSQQLNSEKKKSKVHSNVANKDALKNYSTEYADQFANQYIAQQKNQNENAYSNQAYNNTFNARREQLNNTTYYRPQTTIYDGFNNANTQSQYTQPVNNSYSSAPGQARENTYSAYNTATRQAANGTYSTYNTATSQAVNNTYNTGAAQTYNNTYYKPQGTIYDTFKSNTQNKTSQPSQTVIRTARQLNSSNQPKGTIYDTFKKPAMKADRVNASGKNSVENKRTNRNSKRNFSMQSTDSFSVSAPKKKGGFVL